MLSVIILKKDMKFIQSLNVVRRKFFKKKIFLDIYGGIKVLDRYFSLSTQNGGLLFTSKEEIDMRRTVSHEQLDGHDPCDVSRVVWDGQDMLKNMAAA